MENEKNKLIQFEDLFKEEIERKNKRIEDPINKQNYWRAIFSYLMVMFIVGYLLALLVLSIGFSQTYHEDERVFLAVKQDKGGISLVDETLVDTYLESYASYVKVIGSYNNRMIIVNNENPYIESFLLIFDEASDSWMIDVDILNRIYFLNGDLNEWKDSYLRITRYASSSSIIEDQHEHTIVFIEGKTDLSDDGYSIVNFLVYLVLFPFVWYFLRRQIKHDLLEFSKGVKSYLVPIVVGYLYIIAGGLLSTFLSGMLSKVFRVEPSQAINQMIIIDALRSNYTIFMFIGAVILGPIVEELIFRKALFGIIKSEKKAWVVSSFIFGVVHLLSETSISNALVNGIAYIIMGFVFGYIYIQSKKNVVIVTIVHIITNLIGVLAVLLNF
jgi:membrane protease YdiL (CAAX protease family)